MIHKSNNELHNNKFKLNVKSKWIVMCSVAALLFTPVSQTAFAIPLKAGDSGTQVQETEKMLSKLGYYVQVDSKYDRYTGRAVGLFQTRQGLPSTGILDQGTYDQLKKEVEALNNRVGQPAPSTPAEHEVKQPETKQSETSTGLPIKSGSTGALVEEIEQMLGKLGYFVQVDTSFDHYTDRAVKLFQTKYELPSTGVVDQVTYNQLKKEVEALNNRVGQPAPKQEQPKSPQSTPTTPAPSTPTESEVKQPETKQPGLSVDFEMSAEEKKMIELVNSERVKNGLQSLQPDEQVMKLARLKAQDMVNNNYFSHTSPTYGSPFEMLRNAGVSYQRAGENIAGNWSVENAHISLMNSSGHRANILNSDYDHVGIGIVPGSRYGNIYVQIFIKK